MVVSARVEVHNTSRFSPLECVIVLRGTSGQSEDALCDKLSEYLSVLELEVQIRAVRHRLLAEANTPGVSSMASEALELWDTTLAPALPRPEWAKRVVDGIEGALAAYGVMNRA